MSIHVTRRWAALAVLPILIVQMGSSVANAQPKPSPESGDIATGDVVMDLAAAQLAEDYGLSTREARRRLNRQQALFDLAAQYERQIGSEWAGAYIEHDDAGTLVVQTASVQATQAAKSEPLATGHRVEFKTVTHTLAELNTAGAEALSDTKDQGVNAAVMVDVRTNQAELLVGNSIKGKQVAQESTAAVNRGTPSNEPNRIVISSDSVPVETACQSPYMLCDPSLRGGIGLRSEGGALCTAGFNVYSTSDSKPYVLTAGHCIRRTGIGVIWETEFANGNRHDVGPGHSQYQGTNPDVGVVGGPDVGLIAVTNPGAAGWNPHNHVLVSASSGPHPTTRNEIYPITGIGSSSAVPGGYLCKSGAAYRGTVCGEFEGAGMTHNGFSVGDPSDDQPNLGVVRMENCQGDSGGPVYIGNKAYGINVRGSGAEEEFLGKVTGLGSYNMICWDKTWYEGIAGALATTHTNIRTS